MGQLPQTAHEELLGKDRGSDNVCGVNFANRKVGDFAEKNGRAPRVGLLGGRRKRHPTIDRFWARVQKNPDGCWLFAGSPCNRAGHIHIAREDGSRVYAHRFSFELHKGRVPGRLKVCHTCDVPRCVNPDHLFAGTQKQNIHDAIAKGRFAPWLHPNTIAAKHRQRSLQPTPARSEQPQGHAHVTGQGGEAR
jgi:hypothetical protein